MSIKNIIACVCVGLLSFSAFSQEAKSKNEKVEFNVSGVCGMCKKRIESAALIPGVKLANWDKKSGNLSLIYNAKKIDEMAIHKAIIGVGHDTEKLKADSATYKSLPGCCAYREGDGVEVH